MTKLDFFIHAVHVSGMQHCKMKNEQFNANCNFRQTWDRVLRNHMKNLSVISLYDKRLVHIVTMSRIMALQYREKTHLFIVHECFQACLGAILYSLHIESLVLLWGGIRNRYIKNHAIIDQEVILVLLLKKPFILELINKMSKSTKKHVIFYKPPLEDNIDHNETI